MPPVRMRGDGRKAKNPRKTLLRLLSYMKPYLPHSGLWCCCASLPTPSPRPPAAAPSARWWTSYILPMVRDGSTDSSALWGYLSQAWPASLRLGMISSFLFNCS